MFVLVMSKAEIELTQSLNPVIQRRVQKAMRNRNSSEMVGFVSLLSFELMFQMQPSKIVTGQHKERKFQCKSKGRGGGGGHNF